MMGKWTIVHTASNIDLWQAMILQFSHLVISGIFSGFMYCILNSTFIL
jgi:hypothetical protein